MLLPRMQGVFGRWDWLANGILFALYHLHRFWAVPPILLTSLPFSWAARRYRTVWSRYPCMRSRAPLCCFSSAR